MCPFIENLDERCASYMTMRELDRAFAHCADRYSTCPIYQELIVHDHPNRREVAAVRLAAAS